MNKITSALLRISAISLLAVSSAWASVDDDVAGLQREWEKIKYQMPSTDQEKAFERLVQQADKAIAQNPGKAEALIWHAIIEASYAGARGGLGALGHVKNAKAHLEAALDINPNALDGSAYTSLGSLYYQVPGWPIGFGNDKKAEELLKKGLSVNPDGIDPNYFHGDFLFRAGDYAGAEKALRKALQAPARPTRKLADDGRKKEIQQLLDKIADKRK
jgi:tetratricopeptide (TPR) repeat protein